MANLGDKTTKAAESAEEGDVKKLKCWARHRPQVQRH